jgi:hypothetical protein
MQLFFRVQRGATIPTVAGTTYLLKQEGRKRRGDADVVAVPCSTTPQFTPYMLGAAQGDMSERVAFSPEVYPASQGLARVLLVDIAHV